MADTRPTWELVLEAAHRLTTAGRSPFKLAELIREVQRRDSARDRTSIQPVVQGMTANAGKGPPSPCGKVLLRVDHGYYVLRGPSGVPATSLLPQERTTRPSRSARRARSLTRADVGRRVDSVIERFDEYVDTYDRLVPFTRSGQYEWHRLTIDRRRSVGSLDAAAFDDRFTELLHRTLQAWGIGRRASRLASLSSFRESLRSRVPELAPLEGLSLEDRSLDVEAVASQLDGLISNLAVVDNRALIVAGTKTLHHLLPDLVPPMDRAWTGAFFGWSTLDPQNRQTAIFSEAFEACARIASATLPSRLVGPGWRTSLTKLVDNAIIGSARPRASAGPPDERIATSGESVSEPASVILSATESVYQSSPRVRGLVILLGVLLSIETLHRNG